MRFPSSFGCQRRVPKRFEDRPRGSSAASHETRALRPCHINLQSRQSHIHAFIGSTYLSGSGKKKKQPNIKRYLFWEACADLFENLIHLNKHRVVFLLNRKAGAHERLMDLAERVKHMTPRLPSWKAASKGKPKIENVIAAGSRFLFDFVIYFITSAFRDFHKGR